MDQIGTTTPRPLRKHLLLLETTTAIPSAVDLTRHHGQGNGLRVHAILFAVASVVALALLLVGVVVATSGM